MNPFRTQEKKGIIAELAILLYFCMGSTQVSLSADRNTPAPTAASSQANLGTPARSASINFEDEIVEGMNKNPFDSVTHVGKNDNKNQRHLYKKKMSFKYEIKLNIREMGLLQ